MGFLDDKIRACLLAFSLAVSAWGCSGDSTIPRPGITGSDLQAEVSDAGRPPYDRPVSPDMGFQPADEGIPKYPDARTDIEISPDAGLPPEGFILIPGGTFTMGSDDYSDERPPHSTTISQDYYLHEHEVTQSEYREFTDAMEQLYPSISSSYRGDNRPMVEVTWHDADAYCRWIGGRLPTEAEWERAARGEDGLHEYSTDDGNLTTPGVHYNDSGPGPPGSPRDVCGGRGDYVEWGGVELCDMCGSVWEWVADWYGDYPSGSVTDPTGPASGDYRVLRGGSWGSVALAVRAATRDDSCEPGSGFGNIGFRCARSPEDSAE